MNKKERQIIFDKFGGKCSYCGCELTGKWHIDHASPVHRKTKTIGGDFITKDTGLKATYKDFEDGNFIQTERKQIADGFHRPENHNIDNMLPACVSCNIYKGGADVKTFKWMISNTIKGLNSHNTQFKFAKRFGLVKETNIEVKFYFEEYENQQK